MYLFCRTLSFCGDFDQESCSFVVIGETGSLSIGCGDFWFSDYLSLDLTLLERVAKFCDLIRSFMNMGGPSFFWNVFMEEINAGLWIVDFLIVEFQPVWFLIVERSWLSVG